MKSKNFTLRKGAALALLLSVCASSAHAVQFRLLGWTSADVNLQSELDGKSTELTVFTEDFSPVYSQKSSGPITLYKVVEHEGKPHKQVACTVNIPDGMEQGVLLLIPGDGAKAVSKKVLPNKHGFVSPQAPLIYNYVWLDDSAGVRPPGTIEFRNMSTRPIAVQIEQHQLTLAPRATSQVPLSPEAKRMAFRAAAQVDGQWKLFASNPLPTRGPSRMMVILRDGPPSTTDGRAPAEPNIRMISLFDWPAPPRTDLASIR